MDLVQASDVRRVHRAGKVDVPALNGATLSVGQGEFVAIMGPSGCGKTTLLQLLGGLDRPTSGHIRIDGVDVATLSRSARTLLRREKLGFVFQRFNLIPTLTAAANLELAARIKGAQPARPGWVEEMLDLVGLAHKAGSTPLEMSIGEQQRVAVSRALVGDPRLILADEPTGSLDSESSARVLRLFADVNRKLDQTLVMVTHSEEAASYAHRIIRMRDGRVVS